jgi:hypothetical protein
MAIKVGPGIAFGPLHWVDEVEVISLNGAVKEATLWCGDLATPGVNRRATLLPSGATLTDASAPDPCDIKSPGGYLFEPDGAVIRAGLVQQVAALLGLWQIDRRIAYLSGNESVNSPFVQEFEIEEWEPYSLKRIRRRLRELDVGVLEIKKRGLSIDPDVLRRRLKLAGSEKRTLILTRIGQKAFAFICRRKTKEVEMTPLIGTEY